LCAGYPPARSVAPNFLNHFTGVIIMGFPRQVNVQPAIAVEGDRASTNPNLYSVIAGVGAFIAGLQGVTVGAFAWADPTFTILNSFGAGPVTGFVSREGLRADIVTPGPGFPDSSQTILGGSYVSAFNSGDFYVRNNGSTTSQIGQTCYALNASGLAAFGAAGSPPVGASVTGSIAANVVTASVAPNTATGSIAANVLTVTAEGAGSVLGSGQTVSGPGVDPGTSIVAQISGSPGGVGTYQVSISQNVPAGTALTMSGGGLTVSAVTSGTLAVNQSLTGTNFPAGTTITGLGTGTGGVGTYAISQSFTQASETVTASGGTLTVTAVGSGALALNDVISGAGVTAGNTITGLLTGTGGVGTYLVSIGQTVASETIGVSSGVATKWTAMSVGAPGELVAISATPLG
jgi:hypothetical protein